jgi:iron complex outermembrane recepter protein
VLPDNSLSLPAWTSWGLATRYQWQQGRGTRYTLRAGVDNLFDVRAWKESPYQYDHVYLYPLDPRTVRISLQASL